MLHSALVAAVVALWDTQRLDDMAHGDVLFDLMGKYPIEEQRPQAAGEGE